MRSRTLFEQAAMLSRPLLFSSACSEARTHWRPVWRQAKKCADAPSAAGACKRKSGAKSVLPAWLSSALEGMGRSAVENTRMPCLDKEFARLQPVLPELKRERLVHVQSGVMFCSASLLVGTVHMHTGNGAMLACVSGQEGEEWVYTRCFCACTGKKIMETTLAPILAQTEEWSYPWVMIDKDKYSQLMRRLKSAKGGSPGMQGGGQGKRQRRDPTP